MTAGPGRSPRLQPLVRARVAALGAEGQAWVDALPGLLDELAGRWSLRLGRALPGGSASYLVTAVRADGSDAVLKVALGENDTAAHARALRSADGRGYVRLLEGDPACGALLLERLGPSLDHGSLPVEEQLDALASTLLGAWRPPDSPAYDKAAALGAAVAGWADQHPGLVGPVVVERALACAAALARPDPGDLVVVHGDAHPGNLLRVRAPRAGGATGWVFVDPDPFVADRAYDLGVAVRDFSARLLADPGAAPERFRSWCRRVAAPSGADADRVWAWGFLERVSTGLHVTSFGAHRVAEPFLASAALLARPGAGAPDLLGPPSVLPDSGTPPVPG